VILRALEGRTTMKAIIISDADARGLLDQLELGKMRAANHWPLSSKSSPEDIEQAHRAFHYIVTKWLQEQGAYVLRRG